MYCVLSYYMCCVMALGGDDTISVFLPDGLLVSLVLLMLIMIDDGIIYGC